MRVVVDTNVLVSGALFTSGSTRKVLSLVMRFATPVCSRELVDEYRRVMVKGALDRYTSREKRIALVDAFERASEMVTISGKLRMCRDPRDDMVIETAMLGNADALVTGDKDVIALRPLKGVAIVKPAEFLKLFV